MDLLPLACQDFVKDLGTRLSTMVSRVGVLSKQQLRSYGERISVKSHICTYGEAWGETLSLPATKF